MSTEEDYRALMSDLIKKQMIMLGPNLVLSKARGVLGLTVLDDGTVQKVNGDLGQVLGELTGAFMTLSGQIAQMTLDTLLEKYPGVKSPNS